MMKILDEAFDMVEEFSKTAQLDKELNYKLKLIVEELVVNILNYTSAKEYDLHVELKNAFLHVEISYKDESFDPTQFSKESKDVEEMSFGGLGLFLVNSLAKSIKYDYVEGKNIVKIEL